jgi:zinc protease
MLNRTIAPDYVEIEEISIKKADSTSLSNGIPLFVLNSGEQDLVKVDFIFNAGTWHENQNGVSYFTCNMLKEGTAKFSAKQIAETASLYGAFIEYSHANDRVCISVYVLTKYLAKLTSLLKEILTQPIFPDNELNILKNKLIQSIKINLEKTSFVAGRTFNKTIFPNHPYGNHLDEKSINDITSEQLKAFLIPIIRSII